MVHGEDLDRRNGGSESSVHFVWGHRTQQDRPEQGPANNAIPMQPSYIGSRSSVTSLFLNNSSSILCISIKINTVIIMIIIIIIIIVIIIIIIIIVIIIIIIIIVDRSITQQCPYYGGRMASPLHRRLIFPKTMYGWSIQLAMVAVGTEDNNGRDVI